jgi:lyso-ornithine lipid O-acyltransferase
MLKAFNVELICKENITEEENSLIVGNHMGFIDIVCLQALRGSVFITSLEMKQTPVLGQITELGGCAYVNRKNRMNIHEELKGITEVLKEGFRVVLYAESVASDGERVLPFKKTLIMAAGLANRPIRPYIFNFRRVNGGPVYFWQRDHLCWYGDQTFFPAIWRSLQLDSVTCEIEFLPLVYPKPEDDRTKVANHLHDIIAEKFVPFYPSMNKETDDQVSSNILSHSV